MNIQIVTNNLRNTIAGKEQYLAKWEKVSDEADHRNTIVSMLKINIAELKRILQDVEQCISKDVEQSWRDNPDRMGGQFTQDEIDNSEKW